MRNFTSSAVKKWLAVVNTSAVIGFVVGVVAALGFNLVTHNRKPANPISECLYSASQAYYIHDDSWQYLDACKGLEAWQLLSVKVSLNNMRSG